MESVVLDTPDGIDARLGWDPGVDEHDRRRILARELVGRRLGVDPDDVAIARESPTNFGQHRLLVASIDEVEVPLVIKTADFRAATVVALSAPELVVGIDLRDLHPSDTDRAAMHAHSHLWEGSTDAEFLSHWARVHAVLAADARGTRVRPETVRLDPAGTHGSVTDRPTQYRILDLSRNAFVITLAYAALSAEP